MKGMDPRCTSPYYYCIILAATSNDNVAWLAQQSNLGRIQLAELYNVLQDLQAEQPSSFQLLPSPSVQLPPLILHSPFVAS